MKYDDIINLEHPDLAKHPRMSRHDRAAQFSPFAALTGHDEEIEETARITDTVTDLDEDMLEDLDRKLRTIMENTNEKNSITVTYFVPDEKKQGGSYRKLKGSVKKLDDYAHMLIMSDETAIPISSIRELDIEND